GQTGRERRRSGQRDGPELRSGQPVCLGLDLEDLRRDPLADRAEQLRAGLEAVLVEVVARPAARAEHEVALEIRLLPERGPELFVGQERAASRTSRASGSRRSASGEPSVSETIEPSS